MRMEVEKVICDRCGKVISDQVFDVTAEIDVAIGGENLIYEYQELCQRCARTVTKRLMDAGPLKGAPRREGMGDVA